MALRAGARRSRRRARLQWILRRNCSITPRQLFGAYLSLCVLSLAIALGFAWHGASPVLAFAGVELLLVGRGPAGLRAPRHRSRDASRWPAARCPSSIGMAGRPNAREFRAAWVRVEPRQAKVRWSSCRATGRRRASAATCGPSCARRWRCELRAALRAHGRCRAATELNPAHSNRSDDDDPTSPRSATCCPGSALRWVPRSRRGGAGRQRPARRPGGEPARPAPAGDPDRRRAAAGCTTSC